MDKIGAQFVINLTCKVASGSMLIPEKKKSSNSSGNHLAVSKYSKGSKDSKKHLVFPGSDNSDHNLSYYFKQNQRDSKEEYVEVEEQSNDALVQ